MQFLDILLLKSFNNLGNSFCPLTTAVAVSRLSLCWQARRHGSRRMDLRYRLPPLHLPSPLAFHLQFCFPFFLADLERWVGNGVNIKKLAVVSPVETLLEQCNAPAIISRCLATSSSKRGWFATGCRFLFSQLMVLLAGHCDLSEFACNSF